MERATIPFTPCAVCTTTDPPPPETVMIKTSAGTRTFEVPGKVGTFSGYGPDKVPLCRRHAPSAAVNGSGLSAS